MKNRNRRKFQSYSKHKVVATLYKPVRIAVITFLLLAVIAPLPVFSRSIDGAPELSPDAIASATLFFTNRCQGVSKTSKKHWAKSLAFMMSIWDWEPITTGEVKVPSKILGKY